MTPARGHRRSLDAEFCMTVNGIIKPHIKSANVPQQLLQVRSAASCSLRELQALSSSSTNEKLTHDGDKAVKPAAAAGHDVDVAGQITRNVGELWERIRRKVKLRMKLRMSHWRPLTKSGT